jgi:nucleotide-binding universal stress UspA family protein
VPKPYQHILVPIDFSPHAMLALERATDLARQSQAQLTVVYVIPQVIFHPEWATDLEDTMELSDLVEEVRETLAKTVAPYRQAGIAITEHVLAGGPYVEIVRLAAQIRADLIVIGAHGTAERQPVLLGSVAENVARTAPCSVLTVRQPGDATP